MIDIGTKSAFHEQNEETVKKALKGLLRRAYAKKSRQEALDPKDSFREGHPFPCWRNRQTAPLGTRFFRRQRRYPIGVTLPFIYSTRQAFRPSEAATMNAGWPSIMMVARPCSFSP